MARKARKNNTKLAVGLAIVVLIIVILLIVRLPGGQTGRFGGIELSRGFGYRITMQTDIDGDGKDDIKLVDYAHGPSTPYTHTLDAVNGAKIFLATDKTNCLGTSISSTEIKIIDSNPGIPNYICLAPTGSGPSLMMRYTMRVDSPEQADIDWPLINIYISSTSIGSQSGAVGKPVTITANIILTNLELHEGSYNVALNITKIEPASGGIPRFMFYKLEFMTIFAPQSAGETKQVQFSFTPGTAGTYKFVVAADPDNVADEANEKDNVVTVVDSWQAVGPSGQCTYATTVLPNPTDFTNKGDCAAHGYTWVVTAACTDADGDGYWAEEGCWDSVNKQNNVDFDDHDPLSYPNAPEICDDKDNNNNNQIDENCASNTCGDHILRPSKEQCDSPTLGSKTCESLGLPPGTLACKSDCTFDTSGCCAPTNGGVEICDGIDNNCDGVVDEGCDKDHDGYCDSNMVTIGHPPVCPNGGGDCDDNSANVNPGASEVCDFINGHAIDDNCNGKYDESFDKDGDKFSTCGSNVDTGDVVQQDCNDDPNNNGANAYPGFETSLGRTEVCDGIDNNCNGYADEGCDDDNDDYCDSNLERAQPYSCSAAVAGKNCCPKGGGDINDDDPTSNPGVPEICNGVDDNFNGKIDEGCDSDQDGYIDGAMACSGTPQCNDNNGVRAASAPVCHGCASLDCNDNSEGASTQNPSTGLYFENGQCTPHCGDGIKAGQEGCDDSNTVDGDGCSATCIDESTLCGNKQIDTGANEVCDIGTKTTDYADDVLGGKKCSDFTNDEGSAFSEGTLACNAGCKGFDTTKCITKVQATGTSGTAILPSIGLFYAGDSTLYSNSFFYANDAGKTFISELPNAIVAVIIKLGCAFAGKTDCPIDPLPLLASGGANVNCYKLSVDSPQSYGYDLANAGDFCFQIPKTKSFYHITARPKAAGSTSLDISWAKQCPDYDGDGYGAAGTDLSACQQTTADCNDFESAAHSGATELCDGIDNDCNQNTKDGSGETYYEATEITCDGLDNNCDGKIDEGRPAGTTITPFAGGACSTNSACGTNRVDCTKLTDIGVAATACVTKTKVTSGVTTFSNECGVQCQDGYTLCGNSCYLPANGQCASNQWACNQGYRLDTTTNGCSEFCNPGETRPCYTGAADTENVGVCHGGTQACSTLGVWGSCSSQVLPTGEVCDIQDNNCDGIIDNSPGTDTRFSVCPVANDCGPSHTDCTTYEKDAAKNIERMGCISGQCKLLSCTAGYEDADNNLANGCENKLPCADQDRDGYKVPIDANAQCGPLDCNDNDAKIHPGAKETCDGIDNNCDGKIDTDASGAPIVETRSCGLGICAGGQQTRSCDNGQFADWSDCSTSNKATTELCNKLDDDCNGIVDDPFDVDKDGYVANVTACRQAYAGQPLDCNDNNPNVHPGATEVCDGLDNDCNGIIDDISGSVDPNVTGCACSGQSAAKVAQIKRHKEELNKIDDNCDGKLDSKEVDKDLDGFAPYEGDCNDNNDQINPNAKEICGDKKDNNCNGQVDEGCDSAQKNASVFNQALSPPAENITTTPPPPPKLEAPSGEEVPAGAVSGISPQKPADVISETTAGSEPATPEKKVNITLIGIVVALIAAVGGGLAFYFKSKTRAAITEQAESFGVAGPETAAGPTQTQREGLTDFVSSSSAQGFSATNIKETLKEKGWSQEDIDKALSESAESIEQLGKLAKKRGISPEQETGITSYIKDAKSKGFSKEQIRAALINGGWDTAVVDKYL